jgi:hypothetical protein
VFDCSNHREPSWDKAEEDKLIYNAASAAWIVLAIVSPGGSGVDKSEEEQFRLFRQLLAWNDLTHRYKD